MNIVRNGYLINKNKNKKKRRKEKDGKEKV